MTLVPRHETVRWALLAGMRIGVSRTPAVGTKTLLDRFSMLDRYVQLINATTLLRAFACS